MTIGPQVAVAGEAGAGQRGGTVSRLRRGRAALARRCWRSAPFRCWAAPSACFFPARRPATPRRWRGRRPA